MERVNTALQGEDRPAHGGGRWRRRGPGLARIAIRSALAFEPYPGPIGWRNRYQGSYPAAVEVGTVPTGRAEGERDEEGIKGLWDRLLVGGTAWSPTGPVPLMEAGPLILVVDDDQSVRESLPDLLRELGFAAKAFASATELLRSGEASGARGLVLDVGLPDMSGPDLRRELVKRGFDLPTIFITGRSNRSIPPGALRPAGIECLYKPFSEEILRGALDRALSRH